MPFGLKNAPLVYQQMLDNCLWGFVRLPPELEASVEPEVLVGVGLDPAEVLEAASASPPAPRGQPTQATSKSNPAGYVVDASESAGLAAVSSGSRTVFELGRPAPSCMGPVLGRSSYIDDVAGGGSTWEEMVDMLDRLLFRLRYWGISVNLLNSSFGKSAIQYLSHEVSRFGIRATPKIANGLDGLEFPTSLELPELPTKSVVQGEPAGVHVQPLRLPLTRDVEPVVAHPERLPVLEHKVEDVVKPDELAVGQAARVD
ncbi:hypothetical protein P43SY_010573 [Pythium insidiosum]|uniref:Reverse transcriptase n=1 Tax=Pythium insidiosum TaxID=114742 RepID=A0AAD5LPS6_PYTIN|nr:hypothetical protein P43SY_010573 [Pythium insidiosum]